MPLFGREQKPSEFDRRSSSQFGKSASPERSIFPKIGPKKDTSSQKPSLPPKSKTLFEEKSNWSREELKRRIEKSKSYISGAGGEIHSHYERKKMLDELFPERRFSSHISQDEAKTRLRELRRDEYKAKTYGEKTKLSRLRHYLEGETGLRGKY